MAPKFQVRATSGERIAVYGVTAPENLVKFRAGMRSPFRVHHLDITPEVPRCAAHAVRHVCPGDVFGAGSAVGPEVGTGEPGT